MPGRWGSVQPKCGGERGSPCPLTRSSYCGSSRETRLARTGGRWSGSRQAPPSRCRSVPLPRARVTLVHSTDLSSTWEKCRRGHQRIQPKPAFRGEGHPIGGDLGPSGRLPGPGVLKGKPAWINALGGSEPQIELLQVHGLPVQHLTGIQRRQTGRNGSPVLGPVPHIPAPLAAKPAVRRGPETNKRGALPVGGVVPGPIACPSCVGDLVVIVTSRGESVMSLEKFQGIPLLVDRADSSALSPMTKRRMGFDGEAVERQMLRLELEGEGQIPGPVSPKLRRKTKDEVQGQVLDLCLPNCSHRCGHLLGGVGAVHPGQHAGIEALYP